VETERVASNGGPPRKYYRPSREGRRALEAGIAEWQAARDSLDAALGLVEEDAA
jgi:PadR family transcriptional regulator PadR